jgi:hypothetical protein
MNSWSTRFLLPALVLALLAGGADAQSGSGKKLYRWVDKNGQVHYGDSVPPEYADQDRDVLNREGVAVGRQQGAITPEEARAMAEAERVAKEIQKQKLRDRVLLQTYQSAEEIEVLRDRRLELVDAQLKIQEQALANLRATRALFEKLSARYLPISKEADALPIPEGLAQDLRRSESDIVTQLDNIKKKHQEREVISANFEADIKRFKQLREIAPR